MKAQRNLTRPKISLHYNREMEHDELFHYYLSQEIGANQFRCPGHAHIVPGIPGYHGSFATRQPIPREMDLKNPHLGLILSFRRSFPKSAYILAVKGPFSTSSQPVSRKGNLSKSKMPRKRGHLWGQCNWVHTWLSAPEETTTMIRITTRAKVVAFLKYILLRIAEKSDWLAMSHGTRFYRTYPNWKENVTKVMLFDEIAIRRCCNSYFLCFTASGARPPRVRLKTHFTLERRRQFH